MGATAMNLGFVWGSPRPFRVRISGGVNRVLFGYDHSILGAVDQPVDLAWSGQPSPGRRDGWRPWFLCPVDECSTRVAKLHLPHSGGEWRCRRCHGLVYDSQRQTREERLRVHRARLVGRLNGAPEFKIAGDRPFGMWRSTFASLRQEVAELDRRIAAATGAGRGLHP